jgi:hypothetical protein
MPRSEEFSFDCVSSYPPLRVFAFLIHAAVGGVFLRSRPSSLPLRVFAFLIHAALGGVFLRSHTFLSPSSCFLIFNLCRVRRSFPFLMNFVSCKSWVVRASLSFPYAFCFMQVLRCPLDRKGTCPTKVIVPAFGL